MNPKKTIICPGCGWLGTAEQLYLNHYGEGQCPNCVYGPVNGNLRTISELLADTTEQYNEVRMDLFLNAFLRHYMRTEWGREGADGK